MSIFPQNDLVQKQQMTLTPKMVEELKILQMSDLDLMEYIEEQMVDNPLIEEDTPVMGAESGYSEEFPEFSEGYTEYTGNDADFTQYMSESRTLLQHLLTQLGEMKMPQLWRRVAVYLIHNIDDNGYLACDIKGAAIALRANIKLVQKVLRIVQGLEPDGVGARNLKECLLIQLKRRGFLNSTVHIVICNYLEQLASRKYGYISSKTGIAKEQIIEVHELIKCMDPKPGMQISKEDTVKQIIIPELIIKESNGELNVSLFNEKALGIKVANYYKKLMGEGKNSKETKGYIRNKYAKAIALIHAIEQRKRTVLNVATYIVGYQTDFLLKGYRHLKPLTMKTVADTVGLHESTVSRAINEKYIQTPRGLFELKFFFSVQADSENSNGVAGNGLKKLILGLIKTEDKSKPFSDEQIRVKLELDGIRIARRTIAKYRAEMGILPMDQRRIIPHPFNK